MKRVQLIVTGEMEMCALHISLRALFPMAEFLPPHRADSFTSGRVTSDPPSPPRAGISVQPVVNKLAKTLISYVEPGSQRAGHVDLVLVVDDLELVNHDQPGMVTGRFSQAVREELSARRFNGESLRRVEEKLRERCSFHLFSPMTEAYFFGERQALVRAETKRESRFDGGATDVEHFQVADPDYLTAVDGLRPWAKPQRDRHPKHYLSFLCTPHEDALSETNGIHHYRETKQGRAALEALDWRSVLLHQDRACFARSMIHDLADALGLDAPATGACAAETRRRSGGLLRNL